MDLNDKRVNISESPGKIFLTLLLVTWIAWWTAQLTQAATEENAQKSESSAQSQDNEQVIPERPTYDFDRDWLLDHARQLATEPFALEQLPNEDPLNNIGYDDYRKIMFDIHAAIWRNEERNFSVDLLHSGFIFKNPVQMNLVSGGVSRGVLYEPRVFNFAGETKDLVQPESVNGYSGFRVNTLLNDEHNYNEFLVFQGASYFRATGRNLDYGLSARGIAINVAQPVGEEFPYFTEFWIERPPQNSENIIIHALLESQSMTGVFTFTTVPGDDTVMEVDSVLFPRENLEHYGIAPLTSMFLFNGTNRERFHDYRPEVHDTDGLYLVNGEEEKIWRPLANPSALQVSSFNTTSPGVFGLIQRNREFSFYQDEQARYERRTSAWVEPLDDWGTGHVELVEIPADKEYYDNIVAYWQPDYPLRKGNEYNFRYRLHWGRSATDEEQTGKIVATRIGKALEGDALLMVIDFNIDDTSPDDIEIDAITSAGNFTDMRGYPVDATGNYRVSLRFEPEQANLAELQLRLKESGEPWGETWLYRWTR